MQPSLSPPAPPAAAACGPAIGTIPQPPALPAPCLQPQPPFPRRPLPSLIPPIGCVCGRSGLCVWAEPTPHPVGDEELVLRLGADGVHLGRDDVEVDVLQHTHLGCRRGAEGARLVGMEVGMITKDRGGESHVGTPGVFGLGWGLGEDRGTLRAASQCRRGALGGPVSGS